MRVAVAGGTGVVGRHAVAVLRGRGHDVRVLARSTDVDVTIGQGLDAAVVGVAAVLDLTSIATTRRRTAIEFFTAGTTHLLAAEKQAGVGYHVVLSIVGIDEVNTGYYAGKRRQEELALAGGVPATVLRATQFHEFAGQILDRFAVGPITPAPRMRIRPVAAREVAELLADLATTTATGRAPRRRAQRQHHRNRVIPPLITAPVGDPGEPSQQLGSLYRSRGQAAPNIGIGHDTIDRARARLSKGRMHQQRSSGRDEGR